MNISEMYSNKNLNVTNNINTSLGILDSNEAFESILRDTSVFKENILFAVKQFKKYFGSDILSLLEKIYHITIDKQKIFRIYFTEIFKKKKKIIPKEKENENENSNVISNINISNSLLLDESEIKENNNNYCIHLKSKILRKIKRTNTSFFATPKNKFYLTIEENDN
jgi:hypothetical protein